MNYDIVIVGGGMVGASMACALRDSDYKIAVVEAFKYNADNQPSFDERTVALTYSSRLIFNAINAWPQIRAEAYPILNIEVTDSDSLGFTRLGIDDINTSALGYVVPTRAIGQVLHSKLESQPNLDLFCPATVESIQTHQSHAVVNLAHENSSTALTTKLVIIADGGRSNLLEQLGVKTEVKSYPQCALVGIIGTNRPHDGKAYEHFTADGPLALLPVRDSDFALAWTLKQHEADQLKSCSESEFVNKLQSVFGTRAGSFLSVGQRNVYPLSLSVLKTPTNNRTVVIGNAAHIVHPVAGQGFNLGLRDVGFLHEVLTEDNEIDPGNSEVLNRYQQSRKHDTKRVTLFTDGLIRTFTSDLFPVSVARNMGLSAINLLPVVKNKLLSRTMGIHGRQSRLALIGKQSQS